MAQNLFAATTPPSTNSLALLDANFTELYGLYALIQPAGGGLTATGNIMVSKASPYFLLNAVAPGQVAYLQARVGNLNRWEFGKHSGAESGSNAGSDFWINRFADDGSYISAVVTIERATGNTSVGGQVRPLVDNTYSCGNGSLRWSVVYAATGTINTSDAREKTAVRAMLPAELAAAADLAAELGTFRFLDAVAAKGDGARCHVGMTVQRAIEVMASHGLDPLHYGFVCHDEWPAAGELPAGDRYAFRTDELLLFIARGFDARLRALEAAA